MKKIKMIMKKIKLVLKNFLKNIWYQIENWDRVQSEKRNSRNEQDLREQYNKEAMKLVNAIPDKSMDGYYVIMDGFTVSSKMKAEEALRLVDEIRMKYIEKKMSNSKDIWY